MGVGIKDKPVVTVDGGSNCGVDGGSVWCGGGGGRKCGVVMEVVWRCSGDKWCGDRWRGGFEREA